mgnify:FL=1|jgi:pseudouridylate synthase
MRIKVKEAGELLEYLCNNLDMPRKRIKQYLEHGSIYVNNSRTTKYNYKLNIGNIITIESKNNASLPFDILYEDMHIIVVNKPSGLLTIATDKEKSETLYHKVREYLKVKNKNAKVFIVHRLDKDTSGVVLLAKDEETKNMLQDGWNSNAHRSYVAVVHGKLKNKSGRSIQYLKETKTNLVYVSKDGLEAITNYNVVKENDKYTLVAIDIETGRRNQIRVLFNSMGNPIVGDKKYFIKKDNEKRLYLHANRLQVYYPHKKEVMLFETKTPIEFKNIMK